MKKIPKKIHYCWFGKGPLPELVVKCIESWKKHLPDYEIIEWNEENFDINSNAYCKEAYENRKFAFVADYARLYILYNYGGIYMDTDVEVIKNLDKFLHHEAFSGIENETKITTGVIGARKNNKWIKHLLKYYDDRHFVKEDGSLDLTTNVETVTKMTSEKYKIDINNKLYNLDDVTIYESDYFCPKDWNTGDVYLTNNSHTIHHFDGSWHDKNEKKLIDKRKEYIKKYGIEKGEKKYKRYYLIAAIVIKFNKVLKNPSIIIEKLKGRK